MSIARRPRTPRSFYRQAHEYEMADFDQMNNRCKEILQRMKDEGASAQLLKSMSEIAANVSALRADERGSDKEPIQDFLIRKFSSALESNGVTSGMIGEVGGAQNSWLHKFTNFEHRYLSIFPQPNDPRFIVADITNCPQIPSSSFDAILSVSVLEHVTRINSAAREIVRLLKPGGVTMHAVPFSYFFHGAPVDYWRVTTTALESMFEELDTIECFFYAANRRRNNMGSPANRIDQDGGPQFAIDAFGGWRENWFTVYIGRKTKDGAERLRERRYKQALVDIIKSLVEAGFSENDAPEKALQLARHIKFDEFGAIDVSREPSNIALPVGLDELQHMWATRSKKTVRPSVARWNTFAMLKHVGLV